MKKLIPFLVALLTLAMMYGVQRLNIGQAHAQNTTQPQTNNYISSLSYSSTGVTFANLTLTPPQTNGTLVYCTDCQQTTTCAGSGSGAYAKMVAGVWKCIDGTITGATSTPFAVNGSPVAGTAAAGKILGIGAGGSPIWTQSPAAGATYAINGSAAPASAAAGLILGIGAGGTPVFTASPGAFTVNGSAAPATAAAGLMLLIGPGGTPTFTATPTAFAVNGSPVPGSAAAGLVLGAGPGGTPLWTATPSTSNLASKFMTFQFGNITAVPTASIIQDEHYLINAGTADHLTVTTTNWTCSGNPVINIQDCGTVVNSCGSPTTIGSTTIATPSAVDVTISNSTLTAQHYFALQWTAGTCTVLSGQAELTYH